MRFANYQRTTLQTNDSSISQTVVAEMNSTLFELNKYYVQHTLTETLIVKVCTK